MIDQGGWEQPFRLMAALIFLRKVFKGKGPVTFQDQSANLSHHTGQEKSVVQAPALSSRLSVLSRELASA